MTAGLLTISCSDPVPPPAQGAVTYNMHSATGQTCAPGSHTSNAPLISKATQTVTQNNHGDEAIDGQNGAKVSCKVAPAGAAFDVTATIQVGSTFFAISATIADQQKDAKGSVNMQDEITQASYTAPATTNPPTAPCTFSVATAGSAEGIAAGRVWGEFKCDVVVDPHSAATGAGCGAEGWFVFENCDQ